MAIERWRDEEGVGKRLAAHGLAGLLSIDVEGKENVQMMISVQAGRISLPALRVAVTRFARRPLPFAGASPGQGRMSPSAWAWKRSTM